MANDKLNNKLPEYWDESAVFSKMPEWVKDQNKVLENYIYKNAPSQDSSGFTSIAFNAIPNQFAESWGQSELSKKKKIEIEEDVQDVDFE